MNTVTDAPAWLEPALAKIGLRWPTGDASRLTAASDAWLALADQLRSGQQGADAAAASVWNTNSGQAVDAFQSWWTASAGPTANLGQAGQAAQRIGAALRAAAALVTNTQSALVTQIGPAAPVLNSTSTDAQAEAAALMPALSAARARIDGSARGVAQAIIQLLLQAFLREVSRRQSSQSRPSSRTKPREETDPQGPGGRVQPWIFDRNDGPGCKVPPNSNVIPQIVGNPDPRWVGTGILRIEARPTEADGSRATVIDGVIKNPLPDRAGFEKDWAPIRDSMGLSAPQFQAAHLWGPRFGSEAAAGILLAPGEVNQGFQSNAERFVQDLSRACPAGRLGGTTRRGDKPALVRLELAAVPEQRVQPAGQRRLRSDGLYAERPGGDLPVRHRGTPAVRWRQRRPADPTAGRVRAAESVIAAAPAHTSRC